MTWISFVIELRSGYYILIFPNVNTSSMELLPHPMSIYSMNDNDSHSKLDIVSTDDLGVWITSKPDFNLQCDKASAKAM